MTGARDSFLETSRARVLLALRRATFAVLGCLLASLGVVGEGRSAEVTLRLHHFAPADSLAHEKFLKPWSEKVEAESGGRIEIEVFPDMALGGEPDALFDQVRDGEVDMAWLVPSASPGRFPITGVFELPFMVSRAEPTSRALQAFAGTWLAEEYREVKPLVFHVHDRGVLHLREKRVGRKEDFAGLRIRPPSRAFGAALTALGASPVHMPIAKIPQALSDGSLDGAALPYELAATLKLDGLVAHHSEVPGARGLYTTVMLLAMNRERYESLSGTLREVIDRASGEDMAAVVGRVWDQAEVAARDEAVKIGRDVLVLKEIEVERLRRATSPVVQGWIDQMAVNGLDGTEVLEAARTLIDEFTE